MDGSHLEEQLKIVTLLSQALHNEICRQFAQRNSATTQTNYSGQGFVALEKHQEFGKEYYDT